MARLFPRDENGRGGAAPALLVKEFQQLARDTFPKSISVEGGVPAEIWNTPGDHTQPH